MATTLDRSIRVSPDRVHEVLSEHMLVDGYHIVMDLRKSHGSWIHDSRKGRDVLDFYSNFAACPIGYNHPKMTDPEFREKLMEAALTKPANADVYTTQLAEFVETFSRFLPPNFRSHMFFVEGGSAAIENAVKTAIDWKVRKNFWKGLRSERGTQILHFEQAFHGRTGYALSLTNTADPRKTQYFPKFNWPRLTNPKLRFPVTPEVLKATIEAEELVERQIRVACEERRDDIAALIIEPIQGEGGDNHFRPEFFARLRKLADELEFLFVVDEVQTGVGLTGTMWAFEQMGIEPDIICVGKKLQVGGIAANHRIDDVDSVFKISSRINSTWGGNLCDMVRSQKYLEIIAEDRLVENARVVGERLHASLHGIADEFPGKVSNVRGRGLFVAFDLPDGPTRDRILKVMSENDVLALPSGHQAIRFRPALNISPEEADEGIARLRKALVQGLGGL
jgi:L-lysine 6-transaminase